MTVATNKNQSTKSISIQVGEKVSSNQNLRYAETVSTASIPVKIVNLASIKEGQIDGMINQTFKMSKLLKPPTKKRLIQRVPNYTPNLFSVNSRPKTTN